MFVLPWFVKNPNVLDIAKLELEQRRLPIIVKRHMPDGRYEKFRLSDFILL